MVTAPPQTTIVSCLIFYRCLLTDLLDSMTAAPSRVFHTAVRTILFKKIKKKSTSALSSETSNSCTLSLRGSTWSHTIHPGASGRSPTGLVSAHPTPRGLSGPWLFEHVCQAPASTCGLSISFAWNSFPRHVYTAHSFDYFIYLCIAASAAPFW